MRLALHHLSVKQIKRSAGQSAVAAAAYRAGENLHSDYYGEDSDYTKKKGVITADILMPPHAPPEYKDRETLWNAVEKVEEHPKAQLAYSFDIALQNEFTMDENIELARRFVTEQFVSRGMIADLAVHTPDQGGENPNPHFHVLCPIRPLNEDGTWGKKQKRVYELDEHGSRTPDGKGDYVFEAVPTTDWGRTETLEAWRRAWADLCNAKFEEKGLSDRIDSRSYERQGIDQIPTVHEGPNVRQMEQRGILTDKGDLNRWIRRTNQLRQRIRKLLAELSQHIREISEILTAPREQTLTELVTEYYTLRNKGAWSSTARVGNLKSMSQMVNYLQDNHLRTLSDLAEYKDTLYAKLKAREESSKTAENRMKEVSEFLRQAQNYTDTRPTYDKWYSIKFKGAKERFKTEHDTELRKYYAAERKLKPYFHDGKLPLTKWRNELSALETECEQNQTELNAMKREVQSLRQITIAVDYALKDQQDKHEIRNHEQER